MPDSYSYPGSEVLVNKLNITDPHEWKATETAAIGQRMVALLITPIEGDFDLAHLQAIHAHLVQDFYTWGGQLRTSDTGPGGTALTHCRPQFIPAEADRIFGALADMDHLRGRDADAFAADLAWVWGETTALHPFRDGNTRSQFVLFNQVARAAGWSIDWTGIDPYVFGYARSVAIAGDESGIEALLRPALREPAEIEHVDELVRKLQEAQSAFFHRKAPRSRDELDAALRQAIRDCRAD